MEASLEPHADSATVAITATSTAGMIRRAPARRRSEESAPIHRRKYMFVRYLRLGVKGRLFSRPDVGAEEIGGIMERFPPGHRRTLLLGLAGVTLVAIAVRAPLIGTAFRAPDTAQYLAVAKGVFHGGYINNLRPPGYATLLAVLEALGLNPAEAAVVIQNLIGMVLPAFVLLVGWRFFSPMVGIFAGFLTAASPLATVIEQFALSDYLFSVLVFIGTVMLAKGVLAAGWKRIRGSCS